VPKDHVKKILEEYGNRNGGGEGRHSNELLRNHYVTTLEDVDAFDYYDVGANSYDIGVERLFFLC
jgi:hypothetical protein